MSYVTGDLIQATDYNTQFLAASGPNYGINYIMGTGAADYGLGQTNLSNVAVTDVITAAQWNSLFTAMNNIQNHANISALTSTTAKSAGDTVAIISALQSDLNSLASAVSGGCTGATALTTSSSLLTITTASEGWANTATHEATFTFGSADKLRWFFNAGGKIRVVMSTTQTVTDAKDTAFADLGIGVGNLDIASKSTLRSGNTEVTTTNGLSTGFHNLTTSYQTLLKLTSDNTNYTSNTLEIFAKLDAAVGSATVLTIKTVASDPASDTVFTSPNRAGIPAAIKSTPKMVTNYYSITPNNTEGLVAPSYGLTAAQLSNTTT
jgi:hypothetical protein